MLPIGSVEDDLSVHARLRESDQADGGVVVLPVREGRGVIPVECCGAGHGVSWVSGADDDVVAQAGEACGEAAADLAGADDCDLHGEARSSVTRWRVG